MLNQANNHTESEQVTIVFYLDSHTGPYNFHPTKPGLPVVILARVTDTHRVSIILFKSCSRVRSLLISSHGVNLSFKGNPVSMASAPNTSQSSGYGKVRITILAYEWRSSQNEVSTLIRELAIQWAKSSKVEITLLMPQCSEQDKRESQISHEIKIVKGKKPYRLPLCSNSGKMNFFFYPPRDLQIDVVVSFGPEFGYLAQAMKRFLKCAWVQVVLERDLEYHASKSREGGLPEKRTISRKEESKYHTAHGQKAFNIRESANFVVGVGGKLAKDPCERKRSPKVFEFTPGLFNFRIVPQHSEERKQRKVLVFGRGDADVFQLEGLDIARKAVALLVDTHLVFVKEESAKHEQVLKRFISYLPSDRSSVECCNHSGEHLERLFSQVDLMLIPWRSNGFELTGLKALSACLPILVSKNSGFGEALYKIKLGSLFVIDSEDPKEWAARIKTMWDKPRRTLLREVEDLRMLYEQMNSWPKQSQDLLEEMIKLVPGKQLRWFCTLFEFHFMHLVRKRIFFSQCTTSRCISRNLSDYDFLYI